MGAVAGGSGRRRPAPGPPAADRHARAGGRLPAVRRPSPRALTGPGAVGGPAGLDLRGVLDRPAGGLVSEQTVDELTTQLVDAYGTVDGLVDNGGVVLAKPLLEQTVEDVDRVMHVNTMSCLVTAKRVVPETVRAGGGSAVNVSSVGALVALPDIGVYRASKAAVRRPHPLTRDGVRVCRGAGGLDVASTEAGDGGAGEERGPGPRCGVASLHAAGPGRVGGEPAQSAAWPDGRLVSSFRSSTRPSGLPGERSRRHGDHRPRVREWSQGVVRPEGTHAW
ncbi:SDR family oxidoreductase [Streptomyces sp. 8K308]|nr:SDR family oxidoreductase [Streptomyces sp. 8K308]